MEIDKRTEYNALRQEILELVTIKENYIIAMYTIVAAILCAGFELQNPIVFLVPYIILFPFQNTIAKKNENMIAIGAYIAVCLEEGQGWENNNAELKKVMHEGAPYPEHGPMLRLLTDRVGSRQLGWVCSVSCMIYAVADMLSYQQVIELVEPGVCIILAVILAVLIRKQTRAVYQLAGQRKKYIANLEKYQFEKAEEKERV